MKIKKFLLNKIVIIMEKTQLRIMMMIKRVLKAKTKMKIL
jgi:hypothetical protein